MLKPLWNNEEGVVLPLAVVMVAVITLFGFSAIFLVDSQGSLGQRATHRMEALHYAEAGIHAYLGHENKKANEPWDKFEQDIEFEDGFYYLEDESNQDKPLLRIIRSTGWAKGDETNKRTIEVSIGRRAFNQYAYFSSSDSYLDASGRKVNVVWATGEKCYGPYHTNDTLHISGTPTFYGLVTYVNGVEGVGSNAGKIFKQGHSQISTIEIPATNYELKERSDAKEGGHYYFGRTRILLKGDQYDVKYQEEGQEKYKTNVRLPENGVIYVDGGRNGKFAATSGNLFISGELSGSLTIGAANDIYLTGYDPTEDVWQRNEGTSINPRWVQVAKPTPSGGVQGIIYKNTTFSQIRQGSEIVGYETNTNKGDDLLGLVANKNIVILGKGWFNNHNPIRKTDWRGNVTYEDREYNVAPQNITIHGAIFSIDEGFGYEDDSYMTHKKGTITLRGSLIQKIRKPVGLTNGTSGYIKDYAHDPRMLFAAPPSFPEPLNTGWDIKEWEVDP